MRRGRCSERVPDKARVQLDHVIRIDRKISGLLNGSSKDAGYLFVKRRVDAGTGWAVSRAWPVTPSAFTPVAVGLDITYIVSLLFTYDVSQ